MPRLLVSNAEDEYVAKLVESLSEKGVDVVTEPGDQTHVLLTMPDDEAAGDSAIALAESLDCHLLFIANELDPHHQQVLAYLRESNRAWTIVHPIAMMDFAFAALPPQVHMAGVVFGCSGRSLVGFVSASDVMRVLATVVGEPGHEGQEYVCSGPAAIDMPEVVRELGEVLGRDVAYIDLPEDELRDLMVNHGKQDPEVIDRLLLSQLRAWRDGEADVVTDTVERVTGQAPESVRDWFTRHRDDYARPGLAQKAAAKVVRARYRGSVMR